MTLLDCHPLDAVTPVEYLTPSNLVLLMNKLVNIGIITLGTLFELLRCAKPRLESILQHILNNRGGPGLLTMICQLLQEAMLVALDVHNIKYDHDLSFVKDTTDSSVFLDQTCLPGLLLGVSHGVTLSYVFVSLAVV